MRMSLVLAAFKHPHTQHNNQTAQHKTMSRNENDDDYELPVAPKSKPAPKKKAAAKRAPAKKASGARRGRAAPVESSSSGSDDDDDDDASSSASSSSGGTDNDFDAGDGANEPGARWAEVAPELCPRPYLNTWAMLPWSLRQRQPVARCAGFLRRRRRHLRRPCACHPQAALRRAGCCCRCAAPRLQGGRGRGGGRAA